MMATRQGIAPQIPPEAMQQNRDRGTHFPVEVNRAIEGRAGHLVTCCVDHHKSWVVVLLALLDLICPRLSPKCGSRYETLRSSKYRNPESRD